MKYVIFIIILAVILVQDSHPLNPEILKYDEFMQEFEATGRRMKQETAHQKMGGSSVIKRESIKSTDTITSFTKQNEEDWIKKFGTDKDSSGKWQALIDIQDDLLALQAFCAQCHKKAFNLTKGKVTEAFVSDFLLTFTDKKVEPIQTTMAMYTFEERVAEDQKVPYFYFTKSTRPDCVIYIKETKKKYCFWKQVCGITLPKVKVKDVSDIDGDYNVPDEDGPFL